jgi:uncharacterized protein YjbI with pentapeptide repeats
MSCMGSECVEVALAVFLMPTKVTCTRDDLCRAYNVLCRAYRTLCGSLFTETCGEKKATLSKAKLSKAKLSKAN